VVEAVQSVSEGGSYFSSSLLDSLSHSIKAGSVAMIDEHDRLSERELEILVCICQGLSTQEIADKLFISKRTVDKHRANILEKSGCKNSASLVVYAIKNGFIEL
jgi:DNA-binding NarL/FixJ family response regulator